MFPERCWKDVTTASVPAVRPTWGACLTWGPLAFQLGGPGSWWGQVHSSEPGTKGRHVRLRERTLKNPREMPSPWEVRD